MSLEIESLRLRIQAQVGEVCTRSGVRQAVKLIIDAGAAALAWTAAYSLVRGILPATSSVLSWVVFVMAVNLAFHYTRQLYRFTGFEEVRSLLQGMLVMCAVAVTSFVLDRSLKLGIEDPDITLAASLLTSSLWVLVRAATVDFYRHRFTKSHPHRPTVDRRKQPRNGSTSESGLALRTLIMGAGQAGTLLCSELRANPDLKSRVVGFVDDALEKQGTRIQGIPVLGHSILLPTLLRESHAAQVILAMPSAPGSRIRELAQVLHAEGVKVKTLPSMQNFLGNNTWKPELRDIAIEDLLRRAPIQLDLESIRQTLGGSVVLISGAGGSIGSELARQVATFQPSRLVLLGCGENSLWEIERELHRLFPQLPLELELCDIRNPIRLQQAFEAWRPDYVFHEAAHKHVPFLERHPEEGIENNIFGTLNVLKAARSIATRRFVNISTDKAVNPTSVLGVTKRIAEYLVLQAAEEEPLDGRYVSVRFGNVLGSRGSVIPLFHDQIRHGGPLTITHPDMTRYFMTIPEASQLVLQAGMLGKTGKVFVLDMGEPVRILELASDMARLSGLTPGYDIDIEYTGMRPGEKLCEELFTDQERSHSDVHAKVFETAPEPKNPAVLDRQLRTLREALLLPEGVRQQAILQTFREVLPTYSPSPSGLGKYAEWTLPEREACRPTQRVEARMAGLLTSST